MRTNYEHRLLTPNDDGLQVARQQILDFLKREKEERKAKELRKEAEYKIEKQLSDIYKTKEIIDKLDKIKGKYEY